VTLILRFGLAALLLVAGAAKLRDPAGFATEIANYRLLPSLAPLLAATLPAIELVLGTALVAAPPAWRRGAAAGTLAVFALFSAAVISAYVRGVDVACGCFGTGGDAIGPLTLARNAALLAATIALLFITRRDSTTISVRRLSARPPA
jgi:hypothetical protein